MPQLSTRQIVREYLKTETTQGEVSINLNLTLTIQLEQGMVRGMSATAGPSKEDLDKFLVEIPDLAPVSEGDLISFGEEVK